MVNMSRIIEIMRVILRKLRTTRSQKSPIDVNKQKECLYSFKEPENDFERSFFQYKCQALIMGRLYGFFLNFASFFVITPLMLYLLCKKKPKCDTPIDSVFFSNNLNPKFMPNSIQEEFGNIKYISPKETGMCLDHDAMKFIMHIIWKKPFSFYYILKNIIKVSNYTYADLEYNPRAIIASVEYSFTSSLLTCYCERRGIEHINIMHGEMVLNIMRSFFRFHRFFVWDNFYTELCVMLRADKSLFVVEEPDCLKFNNSIEEEVDYTYYLGNESEEELDLLVGYLSFLQNNNNRVVVRPHPVFNRLEKEKEIFQRMQIEVENISEINIEKSVSRSKNIISQHSTVLYQAYLNNKKVVIDDMTNKKSYDIFKESQYIMFSKPHMLMSDIIKDSRRG